MNFLEHYLKEDNSFYTLDNGDIVYLNPNIEEINSIISRTSSGIRIGIVDKDEIYYWDSDENIHTDVMHDIKRKFESMILWEKDTNIISSDRVTDIEYNEFYYDAMPKLRKLFPNVKFEIEIPNDNNNFQGKYI